MLLFQMILCLLPFFKPSYLVQFSQLNQIYNLLQILVTGIIFIRFIKQRRMSINLVLVLLMELLLFISSVKNDLPYIDVLKNIIQTVSLCSIIEFFSRKDLRKLFLALKIIFEFWIIADFIFALKYPLGVRVGLYNVWLFGAKNGQLMFILPTVFCTYIYNFILNKFKKVRLAEFLLILFMSSYILVTVKSATSIIAIFIFIFLMFFSNSKLYAKISMKSISLIYLALFIGVVFFQIQNNFSSFFMNTFGKDVTFTGRTTIWKKSIEYISKQPFLGYGLEPSNIRIIKMNNIAALNCHNMLLEIAYDGGFLLVSVFTIFWLRLCNSVDNYSRKNNQILKSVLIVYIIELFTEVFSFEVLLWVFILVFSISDYENGGDILNVKK